MPKRGLSPAYFGFVMATGIVAIDAHDTGMPTTATVLFGLNVAAFAVIACVALLHAVRAPRAAWRDVANRRSGPLYLASVAAAAVLGSDFLLLADGRGAAALLGWAAVAAWLVLTYAVFAGITVSERKPPLADGISGTWLLAVVATESIAVLAGYLGHRADRAEALELHFAALAMWLAGTALYTWIAALIFYRWTFFRFGPDDFSSPYWINMGAMAISALAGSLLVGDASESAPLLAALEPFLKGVAVLCWATATWWIPLLLVLFVWRHAGRRMPLRYDAAAWSAVFPVGMYAACTGELADVLHFRFLGVVVTGATYIALAAWAFVFAGLVRSLLGLARSRIAASARRAQ